LIYGTAEAVPLQNDDLIRASLVDQYEVRTDGTVAIFVPVSGESMITVTMKACKGGSELRFAVGEQANAGWGEKKEIPSGRLSRSGLVFSKGCELLIRLRQYLGKV
jgi:hypothetical protein